MDGTTATTLAPSEEDMSKVAEIFGQMRDAVIGASKLASEVDELRNAVGSLRNELEGLRSTNRWMDGQITELRTQRDRALSDINTAQLDLHNMSVERDRLQTHSDNQRETLARLNEQVAALRTERDNQGYRILEVTEERDEVQKKLDAVIGLVCPKVPEPVKEVEQPRDPVTQQFKSYDEDSRPSYEQEPSSKW